MELQETNINLYLKNDITHLYTKINLKHKGMSTLSKNLIAQRLKNPIICLDYSSFISSIFLITPNEDFALSYDLDTEEIFLHQEGSGRSQEKLESRIISCNYQLTIEQLELELRPIKNKKVFTEVLFNSANIMNTIIMGVSSAKKEFVVLKIQDSSYPITIETSESNSFLGPGKYNMKNSISNNCDKINILK